MRSTELHPEKVSRVKNMKSCTWGRNVIVCAMNLHYASKKVMQYAPNLRCTLPRGKNVLFAQ